MSNNKKGLFHQGLVYAMSARDSDQPHRAATPLELFYDLIFVVAIAVAAVNLHHGIIENHIADALLKYVMVFLSIDFVWLPSPVLWLGILGVALATWKTLNLAKHYQTIG